MVGCHGLGAAELLETVALFALQQFCCIVWFSIAMSVDHVVNGQVVRRLLVAKQPAPPQLAVVVVKRRRLSEKQPVPALVARTPSPAVPILPVDPHGFGDMTQAVFDQLHHRKQYRTLL